MSAGFLPGSSEHPTAPSPSTALQRLAGRCRACGVPFSGFAVEDTGVIRVDRARWRGTCPGAALIDVPGACRQLQSAWRPEARAAGSTAPGSGRS